MKRRGATLVLLALIFVPFCLYLVVLLDHGRLLSARAEAQRAADAAALAGASAFLESPLAEVARDRAVAYAGMNYVAQRYLTPDEVAVTVVSESLVVAVVVRRSIHTFLGTFPVAAAAAAGADSIVRLIR